MQAFNDFLRAVSELLKAGAWPGVALFVIYRHKTQVENLAGRIRELLGAKFDPAPGPVQITAVEINPVQALQPLGNTAPATPTSGSGALPASLERLRTPTVVDAEQRLLLVPDVSSASDKERALSTVAAALMVWNLFERLEGTLWGSQLRLLEFVNAINGGAPREQLKTTFYDAAVAQVPAWFQNYSFDRYVDFLSSHGLITTIGNNVAITPHGREYLLWRVQQGRGPKAFG